MQQFDSKVTSKSARPANDNAAKESQSDPLSSRFGKLNLNAPSSTQAVESAKDPVLLGKEADAAKDIKKAGEKPTSQVAVDHEVIDTVTHTIRALVTHPVGAKPHENTSLLQDRIRIDATKEQRKAAGEKAERIQQGLEAEDRQKQKPPVSLTVVQGAEHTGREIRSDVIPNVEKNSAIQGIRDLVRESVPNLSYLEAEKTRIRLEQENNVKPAERTALTERNASREGESATFTRDLVRGMNESLPRSILDNSVSLQARNLESVKSITSIHTDYQQPVQEQLVRRTEFDQFIALANKQVADHSGRQTIDEDLELDLIPPIAPRLLKRRFLSKRAARVLERSIKRRTPLERRRAKILADKQKRMRKRRPNRKRLLTFK